MSCEIAEIYDSERKVNVVLLLNKPKKKRKKKRKRKKANAMLTCDGCHLDRHSLWVPTIKSKIDLSPPAY
jgi:hypothetical protein